VDPTATWVVYDASTGLEYDRLAPLTQLKRVEGGP
jgi:hypothetical protein